MLLIACALRFEVAKSFLGWGCERGLMGTGGLPGGPERLQNGILLAGWKTGPKSSYNDWARSKAVGKPEMYRKNCCFLDFVSFFYRKTHILCIFLVFLRNSYKNM